MDFLQWMIRPKPSPVGSYEVKVLSLPEEIDHPEYLPVEIRYIFAHRPEYKEKIRAILSQGKAIGVRTVLKTPDNILKAVHAISTLSQGNFVLSWLPDLLRHQKVPYLTPADHERARAEGCDLDEAVRLILTDRLRFKRLVLIDEDNVRISKAEQQLMTELSELIYPLAVDYSIYRVIADNARERTEIASTIVKALLFVGPIAHALEHYVSGIGKLFAASADDVIGEAAEVMALRGSGFSWKELVKRSYVLIPVFALATCGALSVNTLLKGGHLILAGVVFGLSAVALSLTTAIQSIFMYRKNLRQLVFENKVEPLSTKELNRLAFRQDFTNPARLGLMLGAAMAPFMGIIGAATGLMSNGWVLAAIGSTESIVAGLTVFLADRLNEWRFHRALHRRCLFP